MSFQFKPPVASQQDVRWRDLVRLGPDDDPFWRKVRAAQLDFLSRYLPLNVAVATANTAVVLAAFADRVTPSVLTLWFALQALAMLVWIPRFIHEKRTGRVPEATRRYTVQVTAEMFVVGCAWAMLFVDVLPRTDPAQSMLVVAMTMGAVGVTAFTTAIFPLGALALSGPILLGTLYGMVANDWADVWMIQIIIAGYLIFIVRGNMLTTFAFLARIRTQDRLLEQEEVVRLLLNEFEANGSDWLFEYDADGRLSFASTRFADALRRPVEEVIGSHWSSFLREPKTRAQFRQIIREGQPYRDVLLRVEIEGEIRWWQLSGTPKFDATGVLTGYRGVGSDVTDRQRSAERIVELATFDALTGLVNRRIINIAIADGIRNPEGVALLFVDLDRFKAVNDSLGHGAGDQLLVEVARRLRDAVGAEGQVGRLGGDEFAVVVRSRDLEAATALGQRVIDALSAPYALGDKQAVIGASVGLAIGPEDGESVEELMRAADLALYDVKGKGRGNVRHYDRAMHQRAEHRRSLELDLRQALDLGQLRLAYQPIVDALDERVVGFEALMRWYHPAHGEVPPSLFIPIAEETGQIGRMGRWALNEACRTASTWPRHIKLSVNLSPVQFDEPGLVDDVAEALRRHRILPSRLELELTESLFLEERPQTMDTLRGLHDLGVGFALDDFGTGYSSLGYLQKIAFSRIKIDRSFVRASTSENTESSAIIQAIVALADRLGMETTAEGAETRAEFEAMRRLGCAQIQGFYFGRPMPADEVERVLDRARPLIAFDPEPLGPGQNVIDPLSSPQADDGLWPAAAVPATAHLRPEPQRIPRD
jgi:diguanylate cyclase (GGDEF)-like protein